MKTFLIFLILALGLAACDTLTATPTTVPGDVGNPEADLVGGWNAVTIEGSEVVAPGIPNIIFGADGSVTGNGSCNGFSGTYTIEASRLAIMEIAATEMACSDAGVMERETAFFEALRRVTGFTRDGDNLTLTDEGGNVLVTLIAAAG